VSVIEPSDAVKRRNG